MGRKKNKPNKLLFAPIYFAALLAAGCKSDPSPPSGVVMYRKVQRCAITLPELKRNQYFEVSRAIKKKSGEIVVPLLQVVEPRFSGPFGEVRFEKVWQNLVTELGTLSNQIDLPVDETIQSFLILIRHPGETAEQWKVWQVEANEIMVTMKMPNIEGIKSFSERADKNALLEKLSSAMHFSRELAK